MGRPIGSPNKDKPFRDALRMEYLALESGPKKPKPHRKGTLRWNARKLLMNGSPLAIREIADRLDGKPPQAISGDLEFGVTDPLAALLREINGKTRGLPDT